MLPTHGCSDIEVMIKTYAGSVKLAHPQGADHEWLDALPKSLKLIVQVSAGKPNYTRISQTSSLLKFVLPSHLTDWFAKRYFA